MLKKHTYGCNNIPKQLMVCMIQSMIENTLYFMFENHAMRIKQAIKLLHALVLAINKATCRQDERTSQIKDSYAIITDI